MTEADYAGLFAAASTGDTERLQALLDSGCDAAYQEEQEGKSALMLAAQYGHDDAVELLLLYGAPWNAVDRKGKCAGNYAVAAGHQDIVDRLVNAGVAAELLFSSMGDAFGGRKAEQAEAGAEESAAAPAAAAETKPPRSYLDRSVKFSGENLIDDDQRGVMMKWEQPLMEQHAKMLCEHNGAAGDIVNIGFGLGLIDTAIQRFSPRSHTIVEAHPTVYAKMLADGWDRKPNVRIVHARWQDVVDSLGDFDAVFFDTFDDVQHMHDFHVHLPRLLRKDGLYSFFNGICPENIFFQGVACQVLQIQLRQLGFSAEFEAWEINTGGDPTWQDVAFKYFDSDTYYAPAVKWLPAHAAEG